MIGTGAAIALSLMAGAQTGAQIYATKKSGSINEQALKAQRDSDAAAAALERERLAETRRQADLADKARQEQLAWERERYNSYLEANRPYTQAASGIFGSLLDLMRGAGGSASLPALPPPSAARSYNPSPDAQKAMGVINGLTSNLSPTSASLDTILAGLSKAGISAQRARHGVNGSLASDDKILLPSGEIMDLILDVGGPNARWQANVEGGGPGPSSPDLSNALSMYDLARSAAAPVSSRSPSLGRAVASRLLPAANAPSGMPGMSLQNLMMLAAMGRGGNPALGASGVSAFG